MADSDTPHARQQYTNQLSRLLREKKKKKTSRTIGLSLKASCKNRLITALRSSWAPSTAGVTGSYNIQNKQAITQTRNMFWFFFKLTYLPAYVRTGLHEVEGESQ